MSSKSRNEIHAAVVVAILSVILAIIIVLHHIYKHTEYEFPDRAFQISDVSNHETWVVASLAFATGLILSQSEYLNYKTNL